MRELVAAAALLALACGGTSNGGAAATASKPIWSTDGSASTGDGGAATDGGATTDGGVAGTAFDSIAAVAVQDCAISQGGPQVRAAAVAIEFSAGTGTCGALASKTCDTAKASKAVRILVARGALASQVSQVTVGPGTYTLASQSSGALSAASPGAILTVAAGGAIDATDACSVTSTLATGTVRIDGITSSAVTGHVDLTAGGGQLQGDFTAPICQGLPAPPDLCATANAFAGGGQEPPVDACAPKDASVRYVCSH